MGVLPLNEFKEIINSYTDFLLGLAALLGAVILFHRKFIAPTLNKISALSDLITEQMKENGGGNLVDKVNRVPHIEELIRNNHKIAEGHWRSLESSNKELSRRVGKIEYAIVNKDEQ